MGGMLASAALNFLAGSAGNHARLTVARRTPAKRRPAKKIATPLMAGNCGSSCAAPMNNGGALVLGKPLANTLVCAWRRRLLLDLWWRGADHWSDHGRALPGRTLRQPSDRRVGDPEAPGVQNIFIAPIHR